MKARYNKMMGQLGMDQETKETMLARLTRDRTDTAEGTSGKRKSALPGKVLLAACLAAALAAGALAVELTVGWESFLGRTPEAAVTPVGVSAVTGDYTLTLQESIVDEDGAAFLLALTRNDGDVIKNDPQFLYGWDVRIDGEHLNMGSNSLPPIRSEDGRSVYYCVEFEAMGEEWDQKSVPGKTITFQCDGLADGNWSEEEIEQIRRETVSLAPLAQTARRLDASYEELNSAERRKELTPLIQELSDQATVPLVKKGQGKAWISAVLISDDGLPIVVVGNSRGSVRQEQYLMGGCTALALTDTRTGEQWGCTGYVWQGGDEGFYLCEFQDCPITEDALPYFEVTVDYHTQKFLSDQPVELSFVAGEGHQTAVALDEDIAFNYIGDCTAHVTGASISALRLELTFDQLERSGWDWEDYPQENTQWALVEKDGTQVLLTPPAIRQDQETGAGYIRLEGESENFDRRLIDPDQAAALSIGGVEIPLT